MPDRYQKITVEGKVTNETSNVVTQQDFYYVVDTNDTGDAADLSGVVSADVEARLHGYPMAVTLWNSIANHLVAELNANRLP